MYIKVKAQNYKSRITTRGIKDKKGITEYYPPKTENIWKEYYRDALNTEKEEGDELDENDDNEEVEKDFLFQLSIVLTKPYEIPKEARKFE